MDKPLSQAESKLVAEWLRTVKRADLQNSLIFWKWTPSQAAGFIVKEFALQVSAEEVKQAARRK